MLGLRYTSAAYHYIIYYYEWTVVSVCSFFFSLANYNFVTVKPAQP